MRHHTEFFVNGHICEIKYERREKYSGWIDGEKIDSSHNPKAVADTIKFDAKYREPVEEDFSDVVKAVYEYIDKKDGWVHTKAVRGAIYPLEDHPKNDYRALFQLEEEGFIEEGKVFMGLNDAKMWRTTEKEFENEGDKNE